MHVHLIQVSRTGFYIGLSRKPRQALLKQIHPQGFRPRQQHINPEIKLEPINQIWLGQVPLYHIVRPILDILDVASKEYPPTLALGLRLDDVGPDLALRYSLIVHSELTVL